MRVRSLLGVFSVLLLLAATGCGHVPFGKAHRNHYSVLVHTSAQASVTLPDGYGPITALAGDPTGSGVWFWADTKTTLSIFHVDGQGKLTSWPVLTGADNVYQAESGLAVTSAGMVWLGINATLTRLDPSTGAVQTWRIPAPGDNTAAESFRPPDTQALYLVQAIAASPDGRQIAIGMDLSSSVELFDPAAGTFTQIAMPATSDTPQSLAYAPPTEPWASASPTTRPTSGTPRLSSGQGPPERPRRSPSPTPGRSPTTTPAASSSAPETRPC